MFPVRTGVYGATQTGRERYTASENSAAAVGSQSVVTPTNATARSPTAALAGPFDTEHLPGHPLPTTPVDNGRALYPSALPDQNLKTTPAPTTHPSRDDSPSEKPIP